MPPPRHRQKKKRKERKAHLQPTLFFACTDLVSAAAVGRLERKTIIRIFNNNNNNLKTKRGIPLEITAGESVGTLFPSLCPARSWLGSAEESTQAELLRCNWTLRAGGNCSRLPGLDFSADDAPLRLKTLVSLLSYYYAALIRIPPFPPDFIGCFLPIVTHSSNYLCLNGLPPPSLSLLLALCA